MTTSTERVALLRRRRRTPRRTRTALPAEQRRGPLRHGRTKAPENQSICETCDEYSNPYLDHPRTCDLIQARLEAEAGGRSCCPGRVVAETARVQRDGGCPAGRFGPPTPPPQNAAGAAQGDADGLGAAGPTLGSLEPETRQGPP